MARAQKSYMNVFGVTLLVLGQEGFLELVFGILAVGYPILRLKHWAMGIIRRRGLDRTDCDRFRETKVGL